MPDEDARCDTEAERIHHIAFTSSPAMRRRGGGEEKAAASVARFRILQPKQVEDDATRQKHCEITHVSGRWGSDGRWEKERRGEPYHRKNASNTRVKSNSREVFG